MSLRKPALALLAWSILAAGLAAAHGHLSLSVAWAASPNDPATLYADYRFGPKDRVLDLGIQPLWVPTSAITEAMKRDRVLQRQLAALGLEIRFHPFRLGPEGNAFLSPERLDGMLAGDMPALVAASTNDVVIATLVHQGFGAIVAKDVAKLDELRGKRVAYAPGSSTHFTLLRALQTYGINLNEVRLEPVVDLLSEVDKLNSGQWAAISAWDPVTTSITRMVPGATVVHRSLFEGYLYFTRSVVERHPRPTRLIIAAQLRAMGWMRQSQRNLRQACDWALEEHHRFSGKSAPVTAQEYAGLVKSALLDVMPVPEIDQDKLEPGGLIRAKYDFLLRQGAVPADTPFAKIKGSFDGHLVEVVLSDQAAYRVNEYEYIGAGSPR